MKTVFERSRIESRRRRREVRRQEKEDQPSLKLRIWGLIALVVLLVVFFKLFKLVPRNR